MPLQARMSPSRTLQQCFASGAPKALRPLLDERRYRRYEVVSMIFKGDSRAERYRDHINGRLPGISFMTLAELQRWQLERQWGAIRPSELAEYLTKHVVLRSSRKICARWAHVS